MCVDIFASSGQHKARQLCDYRFRNHELLDVSVRYVRAHSHCCLRFVHTFIHFVCPSPLLSSFPVSSIKSINVDASEQGAIQGALGGIQNFSAAIGPLILGSLFAYGNSDLDLPQLPFWVGGALLVLAVGIAYVLPRGKESGMVPRAPNDDAAGVDVVASQGGGDVGKYDLLAPTGEVVV